ncbi:MAG: hypothetical protein HON90_07275, partial [Halobacteriovoraceae bacterium]|nr:hypothetical protein [Halobacteriovoraceae bacterium]
MKTQISIIVFLVFITGCRPEQEATSFNNIIRGEQNVEAPQSSDTSNIFNSD